ncbi:MAG: excinuclease ABC subunit UvrC [Alphaproteobacteria bacterium]|nr:excinuclease ABC subunit UvrC [Alphaproteobacteria bacterium]
MDPRRAPEGVATDPSVGSRQDAPAAGVEGEPAPSGNDEAAGAAASGIARGVAAIRAALRTMPPTPGVYRMLDRGGDALYVGKARNLKSRVQNYVHVLTLSNRLRRMVAETTAMEIVSTHTEAEALLLECNLIKRLMPRFNVLLRDDKSFPLIHLTADHEFPRLTKFRGVQSKNGDYFGPFASAGAVNRTLVTLQKAFLLRSCSDSVFANRTRPCLLYQIKRCSAPCVGRIMREDYAALIEEARAFLAGGSDAVQQRLAAEMQKAAAALDFEEAGLIRDRIRALTLVQGHQDIHVPGIVDADVIAAHQDGGQTCVQVFFFRGGQNWGNRAYFPSHDRQLSVEEVLGSFVGQFYDNRPKPPLVLLSHRLNEQPLVEEALSLGGMRVTLAVPQRGDKKKLVDRVVGAAREALGRRLAESASQRRLLEGVAAAFGLDAAPNRIEVYDNSHIQGTNAVGAMIVAGPEGLIKGAYRKFNIRGVRTGATAGLAAAIIASRKRPLLIPGTRALASSRLGTSLLAPERKARGAAESAGSPSVVEGEHTQDKPIAGGDDYAMMREVMLRRFARALKEDPEREHGGWPDLVLIDGGQGQLNIAQGVLDELGVTDVAIVGIAKGPDRNAGRERFFMPSRAPFSLDPRDPVLYFLQRLRDEAHRFAIGTHRARRTKAIGRSPLDEIAGIGARRKRALLHHFGSARAVARAGLGELERVTSISKTVAKKIYDHFHADG